ncbi:GAF domain-containing protein [Rhodopseudomonas palustris]|uniref:GAF domain-containing protein n=1 Tax=Rhodopseudomonas palustris TaxID=1076 RepID=UPI00005D93BF
MNHAPTENTVDLTNCDREPIHIPGAIQPHGLLIAFTEDDLRTVSISANLPNFAPLQPDALLGGALTEMFDAEHLVRLRNVLSEPGMIAGSPVALRFAEGTRAELNGSVHRHDDLVFLELETPERDVIDSHAFFGRTSGAIKRLQAAHSLESACVAAAREVRQITGFDRVKIYRFAADYSGQVIAEDRAEGTESFLGLHFPPSDIPVQARKLYTLNPLRMIPDVDYRPIPLLPDLNPRTGKPIDLSFAVLRSVSPIHLEYMRNIGMRGTMSISIMRGDRLWGLIACHNRTPRYASYDAR